MMRSMFGSSYIAPSGLPISWLCQAIGLLPILRYFAPSGLLISWLCQAIGLLPILRYFAPSGLLADSSKMPIFNSEAEMPLTILKREL